ncbi:MAG: M13 family peptidase [Gammaproteobacteria bacterium]|nr:MAG: M13 family peptidase [Gammaproteobacteria bacterium]
MKIKLLHIPALILCTLTVAACTQEMDQSADAGKALALGIETANFDTSVRPQDDFYRYANGTWLENTQIPEDKSNYGSFTALSDGAEENLRVLIEEAAADENKEPGSDAQKVGDFYLSFMNEEAVEAAGTTPLVEPLALIDRIESGADVVAYIGASQRMGLSNPFVLFVNQDSKDSTVYAAFMHQTGLGLPNRDYYLEDDERFVALRDKYRDYVGTMFGLAGLEGGEAAGQTVMDMETAIAEAHWTQVQNRQRDKLYNPYDVSGANELTPGFDWNVFLAAAGLDPTRDFIVRQPSFFTALGTMIAQTPVDDWKTYFRFKLIDSAAPLLSAVFVEASFDMHRRAVQGIEQNQPRWKRAVQATDGNVGELAGKMYVAKHFPPAAKVRMNEMIENLRMVFNESIDELEWMGELTREQAQDKLAKFNTKIGYPDKWRDYSTLEVVAGDLAGNILRSNASQYDRMIGKLGGPIDRTEWFMTPQTVNAYYNPPMNEIVFPAAILQPPFFNVAADDAINYGAIGGVIGHEFSHGFDDQGRKTDGDGNLRDWWTEEDATEFTARAQGLVDQYAAYSPMEGEYLNGELTLGENIGDLAGLTMAYRAYQRSLGGEEAPVIDGFTGDQRFFLGWAQVWARKYREQELLRRLKIDPHSPSEYRANGTVSNIPEFYAAFDVQEGDGMYIAEADRVKIW